MMFLLLHWVYVGVAVFSLAPPPTTSFSRGASPASCQEMTPGHIRAHPQDLRHGYVSVRTSASSYRPGQLVTVTVRSSRDFMGFLLQARGVGNSSAGGGQVLLGGTWALTPPGAHTLRCLSDADAVTHSDKQLKRNLSFVWRAPDTPIGDVRFYITVVQSYFVYWAGIQSAVLRDETRSSLSGRNQARETFTISVPPALRDVKDSVEYEKETNQQTSQRSPTRRSTRSHVDASAKTQVTREALEKSGVLSLTTPRRGTSGSSSGVMEERRTEELTDAPTIQEPGDLVQELESLVPPRWTGPTESQTTTADLRSTSEPGIRFKISSANAFHPSRVPLFRWPVATDTTEDDPSPRESRGTSSGLQTNPSQTLLLNSSHVFPGTGVPLTDATIHGTQRGQTEKPPQPWTKAFLFTDGQTEDPPLFPNQTLDEGSDDGGFQISLETTSLAVYSVSSDASSASTHFNSSSSNSFSSSFASSSSSVGSSRSTTLAHSSSSSSTNHLHTAAALLKPPTPSPISIPLHRLPVQPSSTNPQRPPESPSPPVPSSTPSSSLLISSTLTSPSLVPSTASLRSTSPRPGTSPVPHSLNVTLASSPVPLASGKPTAGRRLVSRLVSTSDPDPTPTAVIHPNPKPHPNLKVDPGHEAKPNAPNGKANPAPETPDKGGKYPDIIPRHSDWELGMLLGCSAGLGMALVVAVRYVYRQACGRRTGVTLNDREREYTRGERGLIQVQECGDLVRVRKIRENSFVLLAEYDILATPSD